MNNKKVALIGLFIICALIGLDILVVIYAPRYAAIMGGFTGATVWTTIRLTMFRRH